MTNTVLERSTVSIPARSGSRLAAKKLALSCLALAVGLGAVWYGHDWWTFGRFVESTDDAYVGANVTSISPHVAGFVSQILVADNQRVRAGQLLIRLDDRDFQATLDHADAIGRQREATLASLHARYLLQESMIRQADADLAAKRARAAFTKEDEARYRSLAQANVASQQSAQKALAADLEAGSAVVSSQAALDAAKQELAVLDSQIAEAQAAVAQAQADLRTARLKLGYTEIRSPIDGYIGNRAVQAGAYVSEGAYLLSIIPAQGLWVDANFKEDQLARMTPPQAAAITADVMPGHVFHGHVLSLAPGTGAIFSVIPPENATGNFTKIVQRIPVRIELDSGDAMLGRLRPGLSTTVTVDTRSDSGGTK
jgi:membrane fusion protein, multidrug efflux system